METGEAGLSGCAGAAQNAWHAHVRPDFYRVIVPADRGPRGLAPAQVPWRTVDRRQDAAAVLKKVQGSLDPLVITQRGRAIAVIHSMEAYEKPLQEHELMRLLAVGKPEATAAEGCAPSRMFADFSPADGVCA